MHKERNEWIDQRAYNTYRYCIKEEYTERVIEHKTAYHFIKTWLYTYSDGTTEQLVMTEKFKK